MPVPVRARVSMLVMSYNYVTQSPFEMRLLDGSNDAHELGFGRHP